MTIQLFSSTIATPLGALQCIADNHHLYLLTFTDSCRLSNQMNLINSFAGLPIVPGKNEIIEQIRNELKEYFDGIRCVFTIPLMPLGTSFQKNVWKELQTISYGTTLSYGEVAHRLSKPTAQRAVANAHGANFFALIVPCHRVINKNGSLGGYSCGIERKRWLIDLERRFTLTT